MTQIKKLFPITSEHLMTSSEIERSVTDLLEGLKKVKKTCVAFNGCKEEAIFIVTMTSEVSGDLKWRAQKIRACLDLVGLEDIELRVGGLTVESPDWEASVWETRD